MLALPREQMQKQGEKYLRLNLNLKHTLYSNLLSPLLLLLLPSPPLSLLGLFTKTVPYCAQTTRIQTCLINSPFHHCVFLLLDFSCSPCAPCPNTPCRYYIYSHPNNAPSAPDGHSDASAHLHILNLFFL